ncbi:hypothetical protein EMIHUDRAFT_98528 [Emiliania huxleyi CCMP1516]|uniref:Uncharacterized protein n=2 Tax=Emiliania huxleyi TaxID=2903 RepID=A0A0D3KIE0_EMIH1|nr:hypothetical protein EMIHUDRAFT_98528 [Emiliania huxleyi CCMP1516]EOD35525.1 hypothetical protein EMIHUDRAFT_98528 [Emiliania huxleyi CCMP1516]|eukprot:XP_005787954.1 hypothetical protein EMIHUDRAFT_98528 [Emiliania huxleyi CCMP1516]
MPARLRAALLVLLAQCPAAQGTPSPPPYPPTPDYDCDAMTGRSEIAGGDSCSTIDIDTEGPCDLWYQETSTAGKYKFCYGPTADEPDQCSNIKPAASQPAAAVAAAAVAAAAVAAAAIASSAVPAAPIPAAARAAAVSAAAFSAAAVAAAAVASASIAATADTAAAYGAAAQPAAAFAAATGASAAVASASVASTAPAASQPAASLAAAALAAAALAAAALATTAVAATAVAAASQPAAAVAAAAVAAAAIAAASVTSSALAAAPFTAAALAAAVAAAAVAPASIAATAVAATAVAAASQPAAAVAAAAVAAAAIAAAALAAAALAAAALATTAVAATAVAAASQPAAALAATSVASAPEPTAAVAAAVAAAAITATLAAAVSPAPFSTTPFFTAELDGGTCTVVIWPDGSYSPPRYLITWYNPPNDQLLAEAPGRNSISGLVTEGDGPGDSAFVTNIVVTFTKTYVAQDVTGASLEVEVDDSIDEVTEGVADELASLASFGPTIASAERAAVITSRPAVAAGVTAGAAAAAAVTTATFAATPFLSSPDPRWGSPGTSAATGGSPTYTVSATGAAVPPNLSSSFRTGEADFRGEDGATYNMLSHTNVSVNALFEASAFLIWGGVKVRGSFVTDAFWTIKSNLTGGPAASFEDVSVSMSRRGNAEVLGVRTCAWHIEAVARLIWRSTTPGKKQIDLSFAPLRDPLSGTVAVAPHGLIGQSYDGDAVAVDGKQDHYRELWKAQGSGKELTTQAQAEGAIEGEGNDYQVADFFATEFKYSRFAGSAAAPRNVAALSGNKRQLSSHPHWGSASGSVGDDARDEGEAISVANAR